MVASTQRVLISALPTTASTPDNACESMRNVGMSLRGMDTPSSVRSAVGTVDEMESKYHCIVNPITSATSLGAATGTLLRLVVVLGGRVGDHMVPQERRAVEIR